MYDSKDPIPAYLVKASQLCIERCKALNLKGTKADNECLTFMLGISSGMQLAGNIAAANHIALVCALTIATRGYLEVAMLAKRPIKDA